MEVTGIVQDGVVRLPDQPHLPEGARIRVVWDDAPKPLELEALLEDDVLADVAWATGDRFA